MIVDSTVLISLAKLGKIEWVNNCIIPDKVSKEITNEPAKSALLTIKFKERIPSEKSKKKSLNILGDKIETGDSDIIALLIESPSSVIDTDDKRLRNVCRALGGKVTGTLGLLINSVKKQIISKDVALELVNKLNKIGFRMSLELYKAVKKKIEKI